MINIFIGFDPREAVAYNVLASSIQARSSEPVSICPLMLTQLRMLMTRPRHQLQSTDFSFSRFLVPFLSGFKGYSIFLDCDMLVLDDISRLWALRDDQYAVQVVKHDHRPVETVKFLGEPQSRYEKKNWSSVMIFNNAKCGMLSPEYVNGATGLDLHQFKWLKDDSLIGALPNRWNHLVGYDPKTADVSLVHYTLGGPYFPEYADCEYSDHWRAELDAACFAGLKPYFR
jgi:hypothetical protein